MAGVYRVALNFYDFSSDPQKYVHANKNHHKHFSRKNLLQKKYSLTYKAPSTVSQEEYQKLCFSTINTESCEFSK